MPVDRLDAHTVADAQRLQVALGLLRRARGHFVGELLAIDPHRMRSYSKRQMCRYRGDETSKPFKVAQTFFCLRYPKRWHVEELFNTHQALGWKRAGTTNLNIRYGQMTTGLIAQAAIRQFRQRLGEPHGSWDAKHLAHDVFKAIDGDLRVCDDTIVVTLYNAPNADRLRDHYEDLPEKLAAENVPPQIPWLYNFKLDFRFK